MNSDKGRIFSEHWRKRFVNNGGVLPNVIAPYSLILRMERKNMKTCFKK